MHFRKPPVFCSGVYSIWLRQAFANVRNVRGGQYDREKASGTQVRASYDLRQNGVSLCLPLGIFIPSG